MTSETTPEMLAMAQRWMGKLSRNEFDHLLLLVAEARGDGSRTATKLAAKLAEEFGMTENSKGVPVMLPSHQRLATALRNGEHYHDR